MISILVLATILVAIAALLLYRSEKTANYQILEMDKKIKLQSSVNRDLEQANIQFQLLNKKLTNELQFWKYRRKLLKEVPVSFRKKKIRGKKRKAQK
jgi:hypothetical protein